MSGTEHRAWFYLAGLRFCSRLGQQGRNQLLFYSFKCTAAVAAVVGQPLCWHKESDVLPPAISAECVLGLAAAL